jgi:CheY-like chemotaxis protein
MYLCRELKVNSKTVLVIDDDEISLLILQNALEIAGHQTIITTNSTLAVELFNQHRPDVVVLDVFMPGKDGFELIKELRALCDKSFIIAISANDQYLRAIKALGADAAVSKVNMPDSIVDCIGRLLLRI